MIDTNPIEGIFQQNSFEDKSDIIIDFKGSLKYPLISPVSTYDEYIEEEPTVIGYTVSTNRRNDKSMNLSKLDELNQVGKDLASNHFLNNAKKLISF